MATYGYVRVSTRSQVDDGLSLDAQQRQIEGYGMIHDLEIDLGVVDLDSKDDKMRYVPEMFRDGVITKNEYRDQFGLSKIEDGNELAPIDVMTRFSADTSGAMKEALQPDEKDSVWKSRLVSKRKLERS